jgi:hypothetical protein
MRSSVLCPFYQRNPSSGDPLLGSSIGAVRMLHVEDLDKDPFPNAETHARLWTLGDEGELALALKGRPGADQYFELCRPKYEKLRAMGIRHISGINEPFLWNQTQLTLASAFQVRLAELLGNFGMHYWCWDWSVGWPDWGLSQHWVNSVRVARQTGGGLCVHMYGAPRVFCNQHYPDEHYALRVERQIRELYQAGLQPDDRWIIVGECGIDGGIVEWGKPPFTGRTRRGWKEWVDWPGYNGQGLTEGVYWSQLDLYDDVLRAIPEIRWAFVFVADPEPGWWDFELTNLMKAGMVAKHGQRGVDEAIQEHIIPRNPDAALERAALRVNPGAIGVSREVDHAGYRVQAFRFPGDLAHQHIFYVRVGDWGNVQYMTRRD